MKFKTGMTLVETLFVFIIIGIIASFTISSVKPWEKPYKQTYMKMHNALSNTVYNYKLSTHKFPENTTDACKMIIDYLNNTDADDVCTTTFTNVGDDITAGNFAAKLTENNALHFTNGTRMWIGGKSDNSPFETKKINNVEDNISKYYIIYIDLNGNAPPNTIVYSKERPADIIAMLMTDRYSIVPLGFPEIDIRYLQAHYVVASDSDDEEQDFVSEPLTYFEAKNKAFGTTLNSTDTNEYTKYDEDCSENCGELNHKFIRSINEPMSYRYSDWQLPGTFPFKLTDANIAGMFKQPGTEGDLKEIPDIDTGRCKGNGDDSEPKCYVKVFEYQ